MILVVLSGTPKVLSNKRALMITPPIGELALALYTTRASPLLFVIAVAADKRPADQSAARLKTTVCPSTGTSFLSLTVATTSVLLPGVMTDFTA